MYMSATERPSPGHVHRGWGERQGYQPKARNILQCRECLSMAPLSRLLPTRLRQRRGIPSRGHSTHGGRAAAHSAESRRRL